MNTQTPLVQRIRKLLELARHHATPEAEALAAHAKARDLMLEYEISAETVEARDQAGDYVMAFVPMAPVETWRVALFQTAAEMYFCEAFVDNFPMEVATGVGIFGAKRHVEIVVDFGRYLQSAVERKLEAAQGDRKRVTSAFVGSFCDAAAIKLVDRIKQIIRERKGPVVPGTNLPVPLDLAQKAKAALQELAGGDGGIMQKSEKMRTNDLAGMILGVAAGKDIGLDPQIGGAGETNLRLT
jgi:hypothetical protein